MSVKVALYCKSLKYICKKFGNKQITNFHKTTEYKLFDQLNNYNNARIQRKNKKNKMS